jgi:DNA-binding MarR family transcriptional regulator
MPESADIPADEVMQTCAANHTRRAARTITRAYDQALQPCGLKVTQFTILTALTKTSFDSITTMADRLALERSSLSRNLTRLEKQDLVRLRKSGRSQTIEITDAGREKLEDAYPLWREAQDEVEAAIGEENWSDTRSLLRSLARAGATN